MYVGLDGSICFTRILLSPDEERSILKTSRSLLGLPPLVYLHASSLAYLLIACVGAGAGARALFSASSTGGISGTSAPPRALSTWPIMYLLPPAGYAGILFGFNSTSRLASLGARSWYWHSSSRSFDGCLSGTGSPCSAFSGSDVSGGRAFPGAPPIGVVSCSPLLTCGSSSLEVLLCHTLNGSHVLENHKFLKIQTTVS